MVYFTDMKKENEEIIKQLYIDSFPEIERKPYSFMVSLCRKKKAWLYEIHDRDSKEIVGMCYLLHDKKNILFDYFAIMPKYQSCGYGAEVLRELSRIYGDYRIFGEVEPIDEKAVNNAQRIRRMKFYIQNGVKPTGIRVSLFGCELELMYMGDTPVTYEQYIDFQKYIFGFWGRRVVKKNISFIGNVNPVE